MLPIHYELKYCERCGSLRLRRSDSAESYCPSCEHVLFDAPFSHGALQAKLLRGKHKRAKASLPALPGQAQRPLVHGGLQ